MNRNISWLVEAKIKKGKLDNLKNWITKASSQVKKTEAGTMAYEFWLSPDKKRFIIITDILILRL